MIVNLKFVNLLDPQTSITYSQALALSRQNGFGDIPFGEYCLAVGIVRYAAEHGVPVDLCVQKIRGYHDPVEIGRDAGFSRPVLSGCCGGGAVV